MSPRSQVHVFTLCIAAAFQLVFSFKSKIGYSRQNPGLMYPMVSMGNVKEIDSQSSLDWLIEKIV